MSDSDSDTAQFSLFKDALASQLLGRAELRGGSSDAGDELDDFVSYLSREAWPLLPERYQSATHEDRAHIPDPATLSLDALSAAFVDTLVAYRIAEDAEGAAAFLRRVISEYVEQATAPPPVWASTRKTECEICEREAPLTYHHLVPRSTHAKALKKGWHPESMLNKVAWLCRSCHSAVHHVAPNDVLAQHYHTVELLLEREDIQRWRKYAAKQKVRTRIRQGK